MLGYLYFTENNLRKSFFIALIFTLLCMVVGLISQVIVVWMLFVLGIGVMAVIGMKTTKKRQKQFHKTIREMKLETMNIDEDDPEYDTKEVDFTLEEQEWVDRQDRRYRGSIIMSWFFIILLVVILFSML